MIGLLPHRRPHADQVFEALRRDSGLTKAQAALLSEIYVLEGRLEHASPNVDAEEVRDAVERLRKALPALIESVVAWLGRHGVANFDVVRDVDGTPQEVAAGRERPERRRSSAG